MANISAASVAAVVLIFIGLIATIVALAGDRWAVWEISVATTTVKSHYGLINVCVCQPLDTCICIKYADRSDESIPGYLRACLAGVCLAFVGNLVAFFIMIAWILNVGSESLMKILKVVVMVSLVVAVFWNLIAVIVFAAMDKDKQQEASGAVPGVELDYTLGWAWGMAILAAILELVGSFMTALSQKLE